MKLYTIGYSGYDRDTFVAELIKYGIRCVLDVRTLPVSRYRSEFNQEPLKAFLKKYGILYRHMAEAFGARQEKREYQNAEGYVDFERFAYSASFQRGLIQVTQSMKQGWKFVLMCAEKDAVQCHRAILVARHIRQMGYDVVHISPNGEETHEQLENRLLNIYFPERYQLSLLEAVHTDEELLQQAYRLQNQKIGFRIQHEREYE